jgi:hypothetical protein
VAALLASDHETLAGRWRREHGRMVGQKVRRKTRLPVTSPLETPRRMVDARGAFELGIACGLIPSGSHSSESVVSLPLNLEIPGQGRVLHGSSTHLYGRNP